MTQISRLQPGNKTLTPAYTDSGPYAADEWAEFERTLHDGQRADSGVVPTYYELLEPLTDGSNIYIASGAALCHGHLLLNDDVVTITPTAPGAPATYAVVACQNNTNGVYNTDLDTPAPYAAGIPAYQTRLAVLRTAALVQNANYWMIPLAYFDIDAGGVITGLTDARLYTSTRLIIGAIADTDADLHTGLALGVTSINGVADDLGITLDFELIDDNFDTNVAARIAARWQDASDGSEQARLEFRTEAGGAENLGGVLVAPETAGADGNARGSGAVDWQGVRAFATQVASGNAAVISGGETNTASDDYAVVAGGYGNAASATYTTVGGGSANFSSDDHATIGGGGGNFASGEYATVGGGGSNAASGYMAAVGGGNGNTASGDYATVPGGDDNTASADYATVPGGANNVASGASALAEGNSASATDANSFVWADGNVTLSWGVNTWTARCHGGARFYSAAGVATGVQLAAGANAWGAISDQAAKDLADPIAPTDILAALLTVPLYHYRLKAQASGAHHIGPTAQDFNPAFAFDEDPERINTLDAICVALGAIQGLAQQVADLQKRLEELERRGA